MESMRVGGLVSGLDTNAIIDNLMTTAQEPINKMNQQVELLTWEQTQYNDILSALSDLKSTLLDLKMESTFKSKLATSTLSSVAEAAASVNTPEGVYTIKVDQTAEPAYAVSTYTSYAMTKTGAGIEDFSSVSKYKYNQIEGQHKVSISNTANGKWIATDTFTSNSSERFNKMSASAMDSSLVDGNGKLTASVNETLSFVFTFNGEAKSIDIDFNYATGTYTTAIAQDLEEKINAAIDKNLTKDGSQSLAIRVDYNEATGAYSFGFYDTSNTNEIEVIGFRDAAYDSSNPTAVDTSTATALAKNLGIFFNQDFSKPESVKAITNTVVSNNETNLATKLNSQKGGLILGAQFKVQPEGLETGTFIVNQDSTLNNRVATKSTYTGGTFTAIVNGATDEEIDAWMKTSLASNQDTDSNGLPYTRNFFDTKPNEDTNGYFHINGVQIDIYDYSTLTPERLIGLINGSGAGVTASFDREEGVFKIENNTTGSGRVELGEIGDTSNILQVMKIAVPSGGTYTAGKTAGAIDTSVPLTSKDSGMNTSITSGLFTINGVSIYIDTSTDSLDTVMKKINSSGAGVTITYDSTTDKFFMSGTGSERITMGSPNDSSNFLEAINLTYDAYREIEIGTQGKNAIFSVNGVKYERESNQVNDAVAGMSLTITDVGTTVINVRIDTDRAVEAMAEFASKYNELINKLSPTEPSKQDKEKYSNPLSDAEKADMSEDDIKEYQSNYERVHYYDMVSKSSELRYLKMNIRNYIMKELPLPNNRFGSLSELGVTIAGSDVQDINVTKVGLLFDITTDKDELVKYIKESTDFADTVAKYSEDVYKFFADNTEVKISKSTGKVITDSNSTEEYTTVTYTGWARRYDTLLINNTTSTSALYKKAGSNGTLDSKINNLKERIETQTLRAENYLERMWAQFAAMEERIATIQNQASYLTQISSGSSNTSG